MLYYRFCIRIKTFKLFKTAQKKIMNYKKNFHYFIYMLYQYILLSIVIIAIANESL